SSWTDRLSVGQPRSTGWERTRQTAQVIKGKLRTKRSSCSGVLSTLVSTGSLGERRYPPRQQTAILCQWQARRSVLVHGVGCCYAYRILGSKAAYSRSTMRLAAT